MLSRTGDLRFRANADPGPRPYITEKKRTKGFPLSESTPLMGCAVARPGVSAHHLRGPLDCMRSECLRVLSSPCKHAGTECHADPPLARHIRHPPGELIPPGPLPRGLAELGVRRVVARSAQQQRSFTAPPQPLAAVSSLARLLSRISLSRAHAHATPAGTAAMLTSVISTWPLYWHSSPMLHFSPRVDLQRMDLVWRQGGW